jgi:uncharacterized protein
MARSSDPVIGAEPPVLVPTPVGDARLWLHRPRGAPACLLVVGHGAGRGADTPDLVALAAELPRVGVAVVRLDQPWVLAGRTVAGPPAQLDQAWLAAVPQAQARFPSGLPLVVAGRSAGARVACRTATALGAVGVVALAFPLHPPGRPEKSRAEELLGSGVRTLVVQGERDAFGGAAEVRGALAGDRRTPIEVVPVPFADHSFRVAARAPVTGAETLAAVVDAVRSWLPP